MPPNWGPLVLAAIHHNLWHKEFTHHQGGAASTLIAALGGVPTAHR